MPLEKSRPFFEHLRVAEKWPNIHQSLFVVMPQPEADPVPRNSSGHCQQQDGRKPQIAGGHQCADAEHNDRSGHQQPDEGQGFG